MWHRWDPTHYLRLADVGYRSTGDDALFIVFFPLFPFLVATVGVFARNLVVASLVVTTVCSVGAGVILYRLARLDAPESEARASVVMLFAVPTAYALFAPYSEALFLLCVLGSMYAARTGRWWIAGLVGMAATATRMVGLALIPALLVEAFVSRGERPGGSWQRVLAAIALVPLGFVYYLALNVAVFGDAFHFLEVQDEHWFQHAVPPWVPVTDALAAIRGTDLTVESFLVHPARLVAIAFALILLAFGWKALRWGDRTFAVATLAMVMSASWLISLPRYLLGIYPLFLTMGRAGRSRVILVCLALLGFSVQLFLFTRFSRGMWAF